MIGRSAHQHGLSLSGIANTFWPFGVGLAAVWIAEVASGRNPRAIRPGLEITTGTVAIGMALRVVAGQGTALAFIAVALGFLGATMATWRVLAGLGPRLVRRLGSSRRR